ncbi:ocia domain-containing protein 2 [Limosa lapponica baueri]|uniref:Ocia domain-containing protein 2 n=1 Tax=Limosa lapponica baueri TaxID=1758121 RepID=A0A2I0TNX6_LIMLA|nr:ocia domain-containing protein 2 [Limosa lapponica baueri]
MSADQDQQQSTRRETMSSETTQQESQTSPPKRTGWSMFYCPNSQTQNAEEIARIREKCRKESFWYRVAGVLGFAIGKVSYIGECQKMFQEIGVVPSDPQQRRRCRHTCKECRAKSGSNEKEGSTPSAS